MGRGRRCERRERMGAEREQPRAAGARRAACRGGAAAAKLVRRALWLARFSPGTAAAGGGYREQPTQRRATALANRRGMIGTRIAMSPQGAAAAAHGLGAGGKPVRRRSGPTGWAAPFDSRCLCRWPFAACLPVLCDLLCWLEPFPFPPMLESQCRGGFPQRLCEISDTTHFISHSCATGRAFERARRSRRRSKLPAQPLPQRTRTDFFPPREPKVARTLGRRPPSARPPLPFGSKWRRRLRSVRARCPETRRFFRSFSV